ncbi:MAG TPA: Crp/Fnr family transcriptional regulator [Thermodesulfobacteriaceae bacterium]|nr:Crp/Fnr family transcriptional regulator [Thermodesulfobacteriaceae bacterium]
MLSPAVSLPREQRLLLRLFSRLDAPHRASLHAFAEFLCQQQEQEEQGNASSVAPEIQVPEDIPRPEEESVVAAMRRLTATFPMVNRDALLDRATALMTSHMLQGQPVAQVIDELEVLFDEHYQIYLDRFPHS